MMEDLAWIERLGGWAAVLAIVHWMMGRLDRMIDNQDRSIAAMQRAVDSFESFRKDDEESHASLMRAQQEILNQIKTLKYLPEQ